VTTKREPDIAKWLIRHLSLWVADERVARECLGRFRFSLEQQPPQLRQVTAGAGAHIIVRMAAPERVLVELDTLAGCAAEDHRTQTSTADGQRLGPLGRRLRVPEPGLGGDLHPPRDTARS